MDELDLQRDLKSERSIGCEGRREGHHSSPGQKILTPQRLQ